MDNRKMCSAWRRVWTARGRVWVGFVVSLIASLPNGFDLAFNVIAIDLKEFFNFTQTQVETVGSLATAGIGFGFLEAIILGKLGYTWTYVVAVLLTAVPAAVLQVATIYRRMFAQQTVAIGLLLMVMNIGGITCSVLVMDVSLRNFSVRYAGTLLGTHMAFNALGKIYYGGLLEFVCQGNFQRFFGVTLVCYAFLFTLCLVLHQPVPRQTDSDDLLLSKSQPVKYETVDTGRDKVSGSWSRLDMFKSTYFHAMFWASLMMYASAFTLMNNITYIAQSINASSPLRLVYVLSIAVFTFRFILGVLCDYLHSEAGNFALLQTCTAASAIALVVAIVALNAWSVYVVALLVGISLGGAATLPITILVSRFGNGRSSDIISSYFSALIVIFLIYQIFVGVLYDRARSEQRSQGSVCFGLDCFLWTFVALLVCVSLAFIIHFVNFFLNRDKKFNKTVA